MMLFTIPNKQIFLKIGKKMGNETENGKLMFIYQAFAAFRSLDMVLNRKLIVKGN